jgi:hypothetical protein
VNPRHTLFGFLLSFNLLIACQASPVIQPTPPTPTLNLEPCKPGHARDFQVGPNAGQLASLDLVPWETLGAGDTVRIFYRPEPYRSKFLIAAKGTLENPVRVCGVKGPNGERPILDGRNATTRAGIVYGASSGNLIHQQRGIVWIGKLASQDYQDYPSYVQIDGLKFQGVYPTYSGFTDSSGNAQNYLPFGACVWVERGHHIVIADNEITDCTQAIFSRSLEEGDFAVTKDLRIAGNLMSNCGVVADDHMHTSYVQSVGVIYEFNRYGAVRDGAFGNSLKDRSVGTVVRYNRIEDGARAMDLVEAEDYATVARADPAYRSTFVYGNQIVKDGRKGSTIHYGGDHAGSEDNYRKGTLYFFNNTVHLTGDGYGVVFQISTTEEHAEVWNNIFVFDASIPYPSMRANQDNAAGFTPGGIVNLGVNWIDKRWGDSDPDHPIGGQLNGVSNIITGETNPIDLQTMIPLPNSQVVDRAQNTVQVASAHPVTYQLDTNFMPKVRSVIGSSMDIGAVER